MRADRLLLSLLIVILALVGGAAACATDASKPMPEIPDPFGLGPRLALVDYLKDTLHVAVEPGASYDDLVAQYWKSVEKPQDDAEAERKDRIERLRFRLKTEFGVDASAIQDEDALKERLAQSERAATVRLSEPRDEDPPAGAARPAPVATRAAPAASRPAPADAMEAGWLDDYDAAVKAAQASGRPILMDFTGSDWCGWCMKLHEEVFSRPEFKQWAASHVILLVVDFPKKTALAPRTAQQNQALAEKYQVGGYPTILVIKADGRAIGRDGYRAGGAQVWIDDLAKRVRELRSD